MDKNTLPEIPVGFGMSLAQNPEALMRFSAMDIKGKQKVIEATHSVKSKQEMQSIVNQISG